MGKRIYFLLAFLEAKFYTWLRLLLGLLKVPCGRKVSFGVSWMDRKVLSFVVMRSMLCSPSFQKLRLVAGQLLYISVLTVSSSVTTGVMK